MHVVVLHCSTSQTVPFSNFPSPGQVEEVRYIIDFPQERNHLSEIQQDFQGSCQFLRSSHFILKFVDPKCFGKIRSPQNMEVSCNCVCDLDLAAQVLWVSW